MSSELFENFSMKTKIYKRIRMGTAEFIFPPRDMIITAPELPRIKTLVKAVKRL